MSDAPPNPAPNETQEGLFLEMIARQANMALIFLGRVPHPQTGERIVEIDTARVFIDQLEMLEVKTRGNLTSRESSLLKQSLMTTRIAFVETVESADKAGDTPPATGEGAGAKPESPTPAPGPQSPPTAGTSPEPAPQAPDAAGDERKKFVKKY